MSGSIPNAGLLTVSPRVSLGGGSSGQLGRQTRDLREQWAKRLKTIRQKVGKNRQAAGAGHRGDKHHRRLTSKITPKTPKPRLTKCLGQGNWSSGVHPVTTDRNRLCQGRGVADFGTTRYEQDHVQANPRLLENGYQRVEGRPWFRLMPSCVCQVIEISSRSDS